MKIHIRQRDGALTIEARTAVERRLAIALGRFGERIGAVTVNLWGKGGPLRSADKRCQIDVSINPARKVTVEHRDPDLLVAAAEAAHRVRRAVARVLEVERDVELRLVLPAPLRPAPREARKLRQTSTRKAKRIQ
jgi:hypothetical protein